MLSTGRLVLRPVTADDHAALLAHWTLPDVRRFLFDGAALSAAEVADNIEESIGDFAARGYGIWIIELGSGAGAELDNPDAIPARGEVSDAFLDGLGHLGRGQRRTIEQEPPDIRLCPVS